MAIPPPDADDIRALIALSRQRIVSFGFCLGKRPGTAVLVMHRDRDASVMARKARQLGETPRLAFGFLSTRGRVVTLTCENTPPPRIAKHVKKFLMGLGLKVKVTLAAEGGAEAPDEANEADPAETTKPVPRDGDWAKLREAVESAARRTIEETPAIGDKLTAALAIADRKARSGDRRGAARALRQIVQAFGLN